MKYINKIIDINADGENFEKAYHIEIEKTELSILLKALEIASETDVNHLYKEHEQLFEKLESIPYYSDKGQFNIEL